MLKDWQGLPIKEEEPDDKIISVWQITPHYDSDYDSLITRDYNDACTFAEGIAVALMDTATEEELLDKGIKLEVKLVKMTLSEYKMLETDLYR